MFNIVPSESSDVRIKKNIIMLIMYSSSLHGRSTGQIVKLHNVQFKEYIDNTLRFMLAALN